MIYIYITYSVKRRSNGGQTAVKRRPKKSGQTAVKRRAVDQLRRRHGRYPPRRPPRDAHPAGGGRGGVGVGGIALRAIDWGPENSGQTAVVKPWWSKK